MKRRNWNMLRESEQRKMPQLRRILMASGGGEKKMTTFFYLTSDR
jgi:hypothetical protein